MKPEPESLDEFIIEHYWAYSPERAEENGCIEYEVEHAPWMIRPADAARFIGEAAPLYGQRFAEVLENPPDSAFLANGSAVSVRRGIPCPVLGPAPQTGPTCVAQPAC